MTSFLSTLSASERNIILAAEVSTISLTRPRLRAVHIIVTARTDWTSSTISSVFHPLINILDNKPSFSFFTLAVSTLTHFLTLKSLRLSQSELESLLTTILVLLSPSSPPLTHPRKVHTALARIVHLLLARNSLRRRLRSRSHLILPILQALLRCLFTPLRANEKQFRQPLWLRQKHLTKHHATRCARLLTLLSDPPLTAVSSSSASRNKPARLQKEPLTDPLSRARAEAARMAPVLLGELASCILKGKWGGDGVREALQPGIWGLLEVVERKGCGIEGLGAFGGSDGAREVLKGLVREWRRHEGNS